MFHFLLMNLLMTVRQEHLVHLYLQQILVSKWWLGGKGRVCRDRCHCLSNGKCLVNNIRHPATLHFLIHNDAAMELQPIVMQRHSAAFQISSVEKERWTINSFQIKCKLKQEEGEASGSMNSLYHTSSFVLICLLVYSFACLLMCLYVYIFLLFVCIFIYFKVDLRVGK